MHTKNLIIGLRPRLAVHLHDGQIELRPSRFPLELLLLPGLVCGPYAVAHYVWNEAFDHARIVCKG